MQFDRTLALLWGDDSTPVGRSGLTIADFTAAATTILDEGGTKALSMRAVAGRLGVRTMATYTFGTKDDLAALVVDRAFRDLYPQRTRRASRDWRRGITAVAAANRRLGLDHPWLADLQAVRSLMGPFELEKRERELAPLEATPLTDVEKDRVLTQVLLHVAGMTRIETALQREREVSGLDDSQWWTAILPTLTPVVDPERFPVAVRVGQASQDARSGEFGGEEAFEFGLERLLDGISLLIDGRRQ